MIKSKYKDKEIEMSLIKGVTPERKKNIGFTDSYADVRQGIMVNSNEVKAACNQPGVIDKVKSCFIEDTSYQ